MSKEEMNAVTNYLRRHFRILGMMRQIPRRLLPTKVKAAIKKHISPYQSPKPAAAYRDRSQASIDKEQGYLAGNLHFWTLVPFREWKDVEARLFLLAEQDDQFLIKDFLRQFLRVAQGTAPIAFLARSGLSKHLLAEILRDEDYGDTSNIADRIRKSEQFTGNLAAAALYLLQPEEVAPLLDRITATYRILPQSYHALLDSFAVVPSARPKSLTGTIPACPTRRPARHRLIVLDALKDPVQISLLFADAEKVTVLAPGDLYGKLAFHDTERLHFRPKEIVVANPRSRITRFSAAYHALHDETWHIANEMIAELEMQSGGMLAEAKPYASLHLADKLFFQVLPTAAFEDFVSAEDYDQIVIASLGNGPQDRFFLSLASGVDLVNDPRIEFMVLSPTANLRAEFAKAVTRALRPTGMDQPSATNLDAITRPLDEILAETRLAKRPNAAKMRRFPNKKQPAAEGSDTSDTQDMPRVLLVTSQVGAYSSSSSRYLDILSRHYNTLTGFVGSDVRAFFKSLPASVLPPPASAVQLLSAASPEDHPRLTNALLAFVDQSRVRLLREGRYRLTAHVLKTRADEIASGALKATFLHWITLQDWFDRMASANQLPDLVVLTPLRPALVGMAAAAARRYGIPSFGLEPHGLNASYCRYSLVGTDRYGVITSYFRKEAAEGFAIPMDRVDVIGSPRLQAPADYDVAERLVAARERITSENKLELGEDETIVTFFTQPSNWDQIAGVWRLTLQALQDLPSVRIFLKLHPEEGPNRIAGYMTIAVELGMAARVDNIISTAVEAIEAADLVLACYSATVVEAAMYRKPVFCVIDGPGDYPLNQHEVVGAPLLRDVESLRQEVSGFLADPAPWQSKALQFLDREPQLLTGPEPPLVDAVNRMLGRSAAENLRPEAEMLRHLFIEGPFQVFDI